MDKVLVHRGLSTLDVIAVGLLGIMIFETLLSGLRSYVFAHTASRIDVELGARLFRHLLAETIRAGGKQLVMEDNDEQAPGKSTLSGRLIDMGYDARTRSVVVRYDALRRKRGGAIEARRFEAIVPGVAPRAKAVGPALNKAANDVARQVADWVG